MRARRARLGRAWVASLAAHTLLAVALLRLSAPRDARRAEDPPAIEIEVATATAPIPAPAPPPAPEAPPRPIRSKPTRVGARPSPPPPSSPSSSSSSDSYSSPSSSPSPSPAPTPAPTPALPDLSFHNLPPGVQSRFAASPPNAAISSRRPSAPNHRPSVDELRFNLERAEDAVANVRSGRVDPLLYDYLRGARARFETEARRLAESLPVGAGTAVRGWGRGYLDRVDQANRGALGAREDAPPGGGGDAPNEPSPHADVLGAYAEASRAADAGAEERRAEVCMDVAPGRAPAVALRRSSGNAALDRLAVESFAKTAAARPLPDAGARAGLACYELRLTAHRIPPLPVFSCGFDHTGITCVWPFKKVTSVRSRLLSVEYPDPHPDAPRSLLRRPR